MEAIVYCDYLVKDFVCKPEPEYYEMVSLGYMLHAPDSFIFNPSKAMKKAGISDPSKCYFVDDNRKNVDAACKLGWAHCVHFCEKGLEAMEGGRIKEIDDARDPGAAENNVVDISTLEDLRKVWPEIFKVQK